MVHGPGLGLIRNDTPRASEELRARDMSRRPCPAQEALQVGGWCFEKQTEGRARGDIRGPNMLIKRMCG